MTRTRRILGFVRRWLWLVSLLLAIACGWLWRRSYRWGDAAAWTRYRSLDDRDLEFSFTSGRGELAFALGTRVNRPLMPGEAEQFRDAPAARTRDSFKHAKYDGPMTLADMLGETPAAPWPAVVSPARPSMRRPPPAPTWPNRAGFGYHGLHREPPTEAFPDGVQNRHVFVVPYWFLTACLAVAPARRLLRTFRALRGRRRLRRGCCAGCGYDLRGQTGRCPECGAEFAAGDAAGGARPERPAADG